MTMRNFKQLLDDVKSVVEDFNDTNFSFVDTKDVPNIGDGQLTFGNGEEKRGKHIKTCVLYVDIRNSVEMTQHHTIEKMGKVFSVFTICVQMAAIRTGGFVRNIIGDRVMVVFPEECCFKNAVECAISINHIINDVVNKKIYDIDVECGIGIDYGDMYCIKVGMPKQGEEREDNRRLVWVGLPANHASRLTDQANKANKEIRYKIKATVKRLFWPRQQSYLSPYETRNMTMSAEKIVENVLIDKIHQATICEREENSEKFPEIMVSEAVYEGYMEECPDRISIKEGYWKKVNSKIRDINYNVYGANLVWKQQ